MIFVNDIQCIKNSHGIKIRSFCKENMFVLIKIKINVNLNLLTVHMLYLTVEKPKASAIDCVLDLHKVVANT